MSCNESTFEGLQQLAAKLVQEHQAAAGARAVAALLCLGFHEGTVMAASACAVEDSTLNLAMVLGLLRACAATEACALTRAHLAQADAAIQQAMLLKATAGASECACIH
ncbi:hypothetical protein D3C71_23870 [compost metagenome]